MPAVRLLAVLGLALLAACSSDSSEPESEADAAVATLAVERSIESLPRSEVTLSAAGASAGGGGVAGASLATASAVRSSNASVQRVFTEFKARQTADGIVLTLPENVLFDFDAADLRADAEQALAQIQTVLAAYPDAPVQIVGHTDARGADAYNQTLSERRAESVRAWLAGRGLAASRLSAVGRGKTEPVAPNETLDGQDNPAGRQQNRRVEIVLQGVTGDAAGVESGQPVSGQPTSTIRVTPSE